MFCVIYQFVVKAGCEQEFVQAWQVRTAEIRREHGGLGSRLHKTGSGSWLAYAQWPSREMWKDAGKVSSVSEASVKMKDAVLSIETLFELDVVSDLLVESI
jgi:heme-degrading monooxygenase HmoA